MKPSATARWSRLLVVCACCSAALIGAAPPGNGALEELGDANLLEAERARRDALWEQALQCRAAGKAAEAIAAAEQVLAIERKHLGDAHPEVLHTQQFLAELHEAREDYASARHARYIVFALLQEVCGPLDWRVVDARLACEHVDLLARLSADGRRQLGQAEEWNARMASLYAEGKYAKSIETGRRALEIRQALLGDEHPAVAESLNNLAVVAKSVGAYEHARKLYHRAVSIRKTVLGEQHPDYAESLSNLATLHHALGEYEVAEPLLQQALRITQATLGEEHAVYATTLHNLAALYWAMGRFADAEPRYRRVLQLRQAILGEDHPDYALSLNNLAVLYRDLGDYRRAEPLYRQALAIWLRSRGEDHPDYGRGLHNLAALYEALGDYGRAAALYRRALDIKQRALGEDHPDYALTLSNLAELSWSMGDFARAEPLCRQAAAIFKEHLGESHPQYVIALNNLAALHWSMNEYARAEELFEEVLAIRRRTHGERHPDTALSLNNLAVLCQSQGDLERAAALYQQAADITEQTLGTEHPMLATSLHNLGFVQKSLGRLAEAEKLYQRALDITQRHHGQQHMEFAKSLYNLAMLQAERGDAAQGARLADRAVHIASRWLESAAAVQSERQQLAMALEVRTYCDGLLSLARLADAPAADVYGSLLPLKGQVFARQRAMRQLREQVAAEPDAPAARAFLELAECARQLDQQAKSVPPPAQRTAHRQRLEELTNRMERLQQDLAQASAAYRDARRQMSLTLADLAGRLPADVALVDVWQYTQYVPGDAQRPTPRWERQYAAFVVRRNEAPGVVWLGSAEAIDAAIDTWRGRRTVGQQTTTALPGLGEPAIEAGRTLRRLVWDRLAPRLGDAQTVLISPDGALGRFPLAALPGKWLGTYLIEDGPAIATLPAPQLLPELLQRPREAQSDAALLLVGDVDYGAEPGAAQGGDGLWNWQPLAAAAAEVLTIRDTFRRVYRDSPTIELQRAMATEQAVRERAPQASYLHFATHGYFAPPTLRSVLSALRGEQDASSLFQRQDVAGWHPGLLSGIVLAGANRPADPQRDDGILTAVEVAALDLGRVEMVVLSACDTGLGATAGGEGLLGLQRAFQLAGARSTVASLWEVPDYATRLLMERFYSELWSQPSPSRHEALRRAQLWVMRQGREALLAARQARAADPTLPTRGADPILDDATTPRLPPYYWAAFVLSGDWR